MKQTLVMTLFMLGISTPLCAQDDTADKDKKVYPKITAADLGACKKEIAVLHREAINYIKIDTGYYCNKGKQEDRNCNTTNELLRESSTTSDIAWFMKGRDNCEVWCYGLSIFNEKPDESFINEYIVEAQLRVFDLEKERSEYKKNNSQYKLNLSPQDNLHWENQSLQETKLSVLTQAVDKCIAKIWLAKLDKNNRATAAANKPDKKPTGNADVKLAAAQPPAEPGAGTVINNTSTGPSQQSVTEPPSIGHIEMNRGPNEVKGAFVNPSKLQPQELRERELAHKKDTQWYEENTRKRRLEREEAKRQRDAVVARQINGQIQGTAPASGGQQVRRIDSSAEARSDTGTGGPKYVRIQSNIKCAAYKIDEKPESRYSPRSAVFAVKNTCDRPMYIHWAFWDGARGNPQDLYYYENELANVDAKTHKGYFMPGESIVSKKFTVSKRDSLKIVFTEVCPIESEASKMAGKTLIGIKARPEQPDLCIGLEYEPTNVPTAN